MGTYLMMILLAQSSAQIGKSEEASLICTNSTDFCSELGFPMGCETESNVIVGFYRYLSRGHLAVALVKADATGKRSVQVSDYEKVNGAFVPSAEKKRWKTLPIRSEDSSPVVGAWSGLDAHCSTRKPRVSKEQNYSVLYVGVPNSGGKFYLLERNKQSSSFENAVAIAGYSLYLYGIAGGGPGEDEARLMLKTKHDELAGEMKKRAPAATNPGAK